MSRKSLVLLIIAAFTLNMSAESMVDCLINDAMHYGGNKTQQDARNNARLRLSDDMTVVVAKIH